MVERNCNALMAIIISFVLLGAFGLQAFLHEIPCPLCLIQRLGMIAVATGALLNVRFGIRKLHYGISLLAALLGGFASLRQLLLHVCGLIPTFGQPFWGLSLYTWALL